MKQNNILLICIAVCISLISLYFFRAHHEDAQQILVGVNANYPPFEYIENGKLVGFEIDLMRLIGKQLNKEIVFKDMSFDALLLEAQLGRIQVIAGAMTPTIERGKQVQFTKTYLEKDPLIVITLKTSKIPENLEDLKGQEVIVNDGYTAESFMEKQEGVFLKRLESPAESFFALKNGKAYAFVSARSVVQPFFDRYGSDDFHILTLSAFDSYALAISKKYTQLFEEISQALDILEKNGELKTLKEKWHLNF